MHPDTLLLKTLDLLCPFITSRARVLTKVNAGQEKASVITAATRKYLHRDLLVHLGPNRGREILGKESKAHPRFHLPVKSVLRSAKGAVCPAQLRGGFLDVGQFEGI